MSGYERKRRERSVNVMVVVWKKKVRIKMVEGGKDCEGKMSV